MKIAVIGLGFVGLVTASALVDAGNEVIGIDIDKEKISKISRGVMPFFEPGLEKLFQRLQGRLAVSSDYSKIRGAEITFIVVPTPTVNDQINLGYVFAAAKEICRINPKTIIVIKSTVVPGTAAKVAKLTGLNIISNPEFTREGSAVEDTLHPDRVIIGGKDIKAREAVEKIWAFTKAPTLITSNENAEFIKYGSNSLLATLISFGNELSDVVEKVPNADMATIIAGMSFDKRIGCTGPYLKPGIGFGGSCFPKDTKALLAFSKTLGKEMNLIDAAIKTNENRIDHVIDIITKNVKKPIATTGIGVLGLAFKEDTDDLRESPSLKLIDRLKSIGVKVNVYDPLVKNIKIKGVKEFSSVDKLVDASDVVIIATNSREFKKLNEMKITKLIIDGRGFLEGKKFQRYVSIGRSAAQS